MTNYKKKLAGLFLTIGFFALLVILFVYIFDPFYQYHGPIFGKAVLFDRDNQMPGSIRNLDYDTLLVGTSLSENCNTDFLDQSYGSKTIKVIRASGSTADHLYYIDMAMREQKIKKIYWELDVFSLEASTENTLGNADIPKYLHTKNVLDDWTYIFNKEIILEKIPMSLAMGMTGKNTGGNAYNWADGKEFSAGKAMQAYEKPETTVDFFDYTESYQNVQSNLASICELIEHNPDIEFVFFMPPYSMSWWDCQYVNGKLDKVLLTTDEAVNRLLPYENVEMHYFQNEQDIICNLDNYMDMIHFSPDINQYILECIVSGENRIDSNNWEKLFQNMQDLSKKITEEYIYKYY